MVWIQEASFTKGHCSRAGGAIATSTGKFCGGREAVGSGHGVRWGSAWMKVKSETGKTNLN